MSTLVSLGLTIPCDREIVLRTKPLRCTMFDADG